MNKVVSLCSGIGGLDLAVLEYFCGHLVAHAEIDKHANAVMEAHFPSSEALGDFTMYDSSELEADILCAGFPCPPVSKANRKQRLGDESDDWLFEDILHFISNMKELPERLVFENVPEIRTFESGNLFRRMLRQLTDYGYSSAWTLVQAGNDFIGSATSRPNIFILACLPEVNRFGTQTLWEELQLPKRRTKISNQWGDYGAAVSRWEEIVGRPHPEPVLPERVGVDPRFHEWLLGFEEGYVTDIIKVRTHQIRLLGNSVMPRQALFALSELDNCFQ